MATAGKIVSTLPASCAPGFSAGALADSASTSISSYVGNHPASPIASIVTFR